MYSSQDLNKSYDLNNGIKKRLSSSKLSQRSSSSRISDRSKVSVGNKTQKGPLKKKDIKVQIKTTNINHIPDRDLKGFKGLFSVGNTKTHSEYTKERDRSSVSINSFRKNDIYSRPQKESLSRKTVDLASESKNEETKGGMGGLLHRIAE